MSRAGRAGSWLVSSKVMMRSAGSSSSTAMRAEAKRAASMMSAQRTSSARSVGLAAEPLRQGAGHEAGAASGPSGPRTSARCRSGSKASRSAGVGKALGWWSNHQSKAGGEAEVDAGRELGLEGVGREGVALLVLEGR